MEDLPDRSTTAQSQASYIKPLKNIASAKRCFSSNEGKEPKQSRRKIVWLIIGPIDPKDELIKQYQVKTVNLNKNFYFLRCNGLNGI